jgi:peptidoglycan/LPS O-acetylase OafA/YrhL
MGALLYHQTQRDDIRIGQPLAVFGALASVGLYLLVHHLWGWLPGMFIHSEYGVAQGFYFHAIGLLAALNIFCVTKLTSLRIPGAIDKSVRWLAGGSFTLYLMHMPILLMMKSVFPDFGNAGLRLSMIMAVTLIAC